jgi:hypothetical protein
VATLEHAKILEGLAGWLNRAVGRQDVIVLLLGLLSPQPPTSPLITSPNSSQHSPLNFMS